MDDPLLIKTLFPSRYFQRCIVAQTRLDGRRLLETRSREVSFDPETATSTARIGSSFIQTTLKVNVLHSNDTRFGTKSRVELHFEISPLCHYSRSKNQVLSKQLGCQLQQLLDSELIVDRSSFRIPNSRSDCRITLQVIALDLDGALFETSLLSCLYALLRFDLPVFEVDMNGIAILTKDPDEGRRVKLHSLPIGFRFGLFEQNLVSDPTEEEEAFMNGLLTIVVDQDHNLLNVWQSGCFGVENLKKAISLAIDGYDNLKPMLSLNEGPNMDDL